MLLEKKEALAVAINKIVPSFDIGDLEDFESEGTMLIANMYEYDSGDGDAVLAIRIMICADSAGSYIERSCDGDVTIPTELLNRTLAVIDSCYNAIADVMKYTGEDSLGKPDNRIDH